MTNHRLDEKDYRLLQLLRQNARTPYSVLAKELRLSETAVRKRIARLVKLGVIKRFTIEYEVAGKEIRAAVLVKTLPQTKVPRISASLLSIPGVETVYEVTGEHDILALVSATSIEELNSCVDAIRSTEGVASTNTMIIMRTWIPGPSVGKNRARHA